MKSVSNNDFSIEINALRGIAIFSVVAFHYNLINFVGGFAGVDIFFVISGYLITSHIVRDLKQNRFYYLSFYTSRIRRIFPALAFLCVCCTCWGWLYQLPKDYLSNSRHELYALLFISNYAFSNERGYFDIASSSKPLLHTWSLSVEGQFYLFLPVFLATVYRFYQQKLLLITASVWVLSFGWCIYYSQIDPADNFYQLSSRAWEFLAGSILALAQLEKSSGLRSNLASIIGSAILTISLGVINSAVIWPSSLTLLPVMGSALIIYAGNVKSTNWLFASPLLQSLGKISYSFYLWHWPVLVLGKQYASFRMDRELSKYEFLELALLSLVLAIVSYQWLEKPIRKKTGWWSAKRIRYGAAIIGLIFIGFTAASAITKGFPNRLPSYVQRGFATVALSTPRKECFRDEKSQKQADEIFCQFGAQQNQIKTLPSMILWGDSHANMYLSALTEAAIATGKTGYIATQTGCRATLTNQANDLIGPAAITCSDFNNEVNEFINNTPSITTVIIGRQWSQGQSFARTISLIKHLVAIGKEVIVIGPVPYLNFNVPETWLHQQIKEQRPIDSMTASVSGQQTLFAIEKQAKSELSELTDRHSVIWLEPLKKLCPQNECVLVNNGVSYFKDVTHLSEAGSMLMTTDFLAAFSRH